MSKFRLGFYTFPCVRQLVQKTVSTDNLFRAFFLCESQIWHSTPTCPSSMLLEWIISPNHRRQKISRLPPDLLLHRIKLSGQTWNANTFLRRDNVDSRFLFDKVEAEWGRLCVSLFIESPDEGLCLRYVSA